MSRPVRVPDLGLLRDREGLVPRAWYEVCGHELRPHQVLVGECPYCHEPITRVLVDRAIAWEIG